MDYDTTITISVQDLAPTAGKALTHFIREADKQWEKSVDVFWKYNKHKRTIWFGKWFGDLRWPTREAVEEYLGKPDSNSTELLKRTPYWQFYHHTDQTLYYKHICKLSKLQPNVEVTIILRDYIALMTFDDID